MVGIFIQGGNSSLPACAFVDPNAIILRKGSLPESLLPDGLLRVSKGLPSVSIAVMTDGPRIVPASVLEAALEKVNFRARTPEEMQYLQMRSYLFSTPEECF